MNFTIFSYFLEIKRSGSISTAAKQLHISQQALSDHVRRLEEELQVKLIRHTRPISLTSEGECFSEYAAKMLRMRKELDRQLAELSGNKLEIALSVPRMGIPPFLSQVLSRFAELEPVCTIHVGELTSTPSREDLLAYDLHLSTSPYPFPMEELVLTGIPSAEANLPISSTYYAIAVRKSLLQRIWGHAFQDNLQQLQAHVDFHLLSKIPFIRYTGYEHNSSMEQIFINLGFQPITTVCADNLELCISLCSSGTGALMIPEGLILRYLEKYQNADMLVLRMDLISPVIQTIISYEKGKMLSQQEQTLIRCLVETF